MDDTNIFNSMTEPIPPLRRDLEIVPIREEGSSYLYFHDSRRYVTENFALEQQAARVLNLLDGRKSIEDLTPYLGEGVTKSRVLDFVRFLDKHRLLHSAYFKKYSEGVERDYEAADVHRAVTAGLSYPSEPEALKEYLSEAFQEAGVTDTEQPGSTRALYAPHIDPRVGMESYVKAFQAIRHLKPRRVVMLGTSHYAGMYPEQYEHKPFIVSDKAFEMPLGTIKSDKEAIHELLSKAADTGLTGHDRAHRIEHSIELHLLFLSHLWDHDFKIVPILVNGFEELLYMPDGHQGKQVDSFAKQLNDQFGEDEDTFFLISGDLAHVGKKFGDSEPARDLFDDVRQFDKQFLNRAEQGADEEMLTLMQKDHDPYRICGFPPLYTFLNAMPQLKGKNITYDLWDEQERESAVSFGSVLYAHSER